MKYQIASQVLRLLPLHWVHATFVVAFLCTQAVVTVQYITSGFVVVVLL